MNRKDKYRERLPIAEWPEVERKMAIIARMTSDPPPQERQEQLLELQDEADTLSPFSGESTQNERNTQIG